MNRKRGELIEEYKIYCEKVDKANRLKYQGWYARIHRGDSFEDIQKYIMSKNRSQYKPYEDYKKLCIDCEPFNIEGYKRYTKKGYTLEQIYESSKAKSTVWRWKRIDYKNNKINMANLFERIRLKRLENITT